MDNCSFNILCPRAIEGRYNDRHKAKIGLLDLTNVLPFATNPYAPKTLPSPHNQTRSMKTALLVSACLLWLVNGSPFQIIKTASTIRRDILGLLGEVDPAPANPDKGAILKPEIPIATPTTATTVTHDTTTSILHAAQPMSTARWSTGTLTSVSTTNLPLTPTAGGPSVSPDPTLATVPSASYGIIEDEQEAPATPPGELTEWKVIGIAVTTITFFATIVLSVVFFDSWWGFLRAAICGAKRAREGEETLVPDWSQRSWEFKLASEDGHRYPTMASLESIVKEKEHARWKDEENAGSRAYEIKSPELAYGGI